MAKDESKDQLGILEEQYLPKYLINTSLFGRRFRVSYNKERWATQKRKRIAIIVVHHESAWSRRVAKGVVASLTNAMAPEALPCFDVLSADAHTNYLHDNIFPYLEEHRSEYAAIVTVGTWVSKKVREYMRLHTWDTTQVFLGVPDPVAAGLITSLKDHAKNLVGVVGATLDYGRYVRLLRLMCPQAKTVLIPYDPEFIYDGFEEEKQRLTHHLNACGMQVRMLTVKAHKDMVEQLTPHLPNIDVVWSLHEEATQIQARHIAKACTKARVLFCASDLASVFQGAAVGFGDSGTLTGMYGGQICFALCAGYEKANKIQNLEVSHPATLRVNPGLFQDFSDTIDPTAAALIKDIVPLGWE